MSGKKLMEELGREVNELVSLGLTKQPTVIDVYVPAPEITVKAAEVVISPQIKVNVQGCDPDVQVVMPPPAERTVTVQHDDGTKSTITSNG